ncbi:MAG: NAD+ synthase [Bryobacteraceae bacterium]|nr:NAD+ synthase [Bryobacteraceae bacterium]
MIVALAQFNPTVGALAANADRMAAMARDAAARGADIVAFPELAICGYPPRDLLEKASFVDGCAREVARLAEITRDLPLAIIVGTVARNPRALGKQLANAAQVLSAGEIVFEQRKMLLPTYDVFDESRYFVPGDKQTIWEYRGRKIALTICEDAWNDKQYWDRPLYTRDPVAELAAAGAELLISINGSPYHYGKRAQRREMFAALAAHHRMPVYYVNQSGGNDQLVFDGSSFALEADGREIAAAVSFAEDLVLPGDHRANLANETEAVYDALVLGTRDYIGKCGFKKVLIGLSGGIDSSITAAIAVDAVGAANVIGVSMPGPYSSDHSLTDAREMAQRLGIRYEVSPITEVCATFEKVLEPLFAGYARDVTEENLQARLRGVTLMALSNKFGAMVLTTGNKSELAVGYCTLYGDMCGGLAVISDVPKTLVYQISRVANQRHPGAIPENVFIKPPSAELRPDQKDSDSLPEYDTLDAILKGYVEESQSPATIASALNLPLALVRDIANKVDRNEYKRQQAAPGLKVTTKAFGIGRRFPIAQRFSE